MSGAINNSEKRIERLRMIIEQLHHGAPPSAVKHQLAAVVKEATAGEIAAMEQQLIGRGIKVEEIMRMCDVHHEVVLDIMASSQTPLPAGHPAEVLRRENAALTLLLQRLRGAAEALSGSKLIQADHLTGLQGGLNELMDIEKHYQRKEHLFFSRLEQHGIEGPSKVMWGKDDEVRGKIKTLRAEVVAKAGDAGALRDALQHAGEDALKAVEDMISKENNILIPMCLDAFTEDDWLIIHRDSPRYGWCLVEPGSEYKPEPAASGPPPAEVRSGFGVDLDTGVLQLEQLKALFSALPVDLTFVDAQDTVRFYSDGERVFPRSKAIIGRKVQHCHPPKSVHIVEQILGDFRSGRQNHAEFWINFHDKFVHIRYLALRGEAGEYMGCLEVTQDLTALRQLEGERRLLEYT